MPPAVSEPYIGSRMALNIVEQTLPPLPYAYNALEPFICEEIMVLHHQKHHQAYVNGLNAAEEAMLTAPTPRERIALQAAYKFNGGGTFPTPKSSDPDIMYSDATHQVISTTHSSGRISPLLHTVPSTAPALAASSSQVVSQTRSTATSAPWTR